VPPPFVVVAVKVTDWPLQIFVFDAAIEIVGVTEGLTVMVMLFEVTVLGSTHANELVTVNVTTSPFCNEFVEKLNPLVDTVFPLIFHAIVGASPWLLIDEENETIDPLQTLVFVVEIDAVRFAGVVTVKVMVLLVTEPPEQLSLLVKVHVI
jgi:hypothetical protein